VEFRDEVAKQAPVGSATVDAEALFVRLAYLAFRMKGQNDAAAIQAVLAIFGKNAPPSVTYTLDYVWPTYNKASENDLVLRRKQ
jgi:hypothetical protein